MSGTNVTTTERVAVERMLTLSDVDARKGPGRRALRLSRALANDLGGDLSISQQMLVQRVAILELLCGHAEASVLLGLPVSIADYVSMASTQRRLLQTLNPSLRRVPRDITSLSELRRFDQHADDPELLP